MTKTLSPLFPPASKPSGGRAGFATNLTAMLKAVAKTDPVAALRAALGLRRAGALHIAMAKNQSIIDAINVVIEPGADVARPGAIEWRIAGRLPFPGRYRKIERTRSEAARTMARIIAGLPWTAAQPDGYLLLHCALAAAYTAGRRIDMVILAAGND